MNKFFKILLLCAFTIFVPSLAFCGEVELLGKVKDNIIRGDCYLLEHNTDLSSYYYELAEEDFNLLTDKDDYIKFRINLGKTISELLCPYLIPTYPHVEEKLSKLYNDTVKHTKKIS